MEVSPFTKTVVAAVQNLYPQKLADSSFDNTGLLLEAPCRQNYSKNSVLLTIDLTTAVASEAITRKDSIIIAYHPIIFRPLKSLTSRNSQQATLLRLAQEGVSVYCPHTAVDAVPGGLNDWLADIVTGKETESQISLSNRSLIKPIPDCPIGFDGAGYGRIVRFHTPVSLKTVLERISNGLNATNGLSVAVPQGITGASKSKISISSIGICAGSGGSLLNGLDVDLLFTGELSHHEALAAIEGGKVVITAGHSNTERIFLRSRMRPLLLEKIRQEINQKSTIGASSVNNVNFSVDISKSDRDPYDIVRLCDEDWK
ncbi:putative ngg1 interacting factor [Erysiphe necator]|uniref:Putative ngg1 interacting factor n=1 Tax=Uncinula necator TaxID=52586 RepID=A0A0B1PB68_UNCNE|nr:putative ngg1 interacting factor [Erysiphe necator]